MSDKYRIFRALVGSKIVPAMLFDDLFIQLIRGKSRLRNNDNRNHFSPFFVRNPDACAFIDA